MRIIVVTLTSVDTYTDHYSWKPSCSLHFKNEVFTALPCARDFGTIVKRNIKKNDKVERQILYTWQIVLSSSNI